MDYKFHYSVVVKIVTLLVIIGLSLLLIYTPYEQYRFYWLYAALLLAIFVIPIVRMPLRLRVDAVGNVTIERLLCKSYYSAERYEPDKVCRPPIDRAIRVCGTGGYMGYRGWFWQSQLGFFRLIQTEECACYLRLRNKSNGFVTFIGIDQCAV